MKTALKAVLLLTMLAALVYWWPSNEDTDQPVRQGQDIRSGDTGNDEAAVEAIEAQLK